MDCLEARDILNDLHCFTGNQKSIGNQTVLLDVEHVMVCADCKAWAKTELCPKVKAERDAGTLSEDFYMLHCMLHDSTLDPDCVAHS
ncbi:MAG: hypothetical protein UX18_C0027G0006 [Candidatus Azambacteria bacterium GW2011_GWC2_45_7b]|uniref:Uncharacterized protein n=1 Tax=Candidatus Azambacteria bacterium GW2011_GWC2_45_7b TaxID=1618621 RepID=A0A837IMW0_9BACT|nr:MAG: hypothetical protein UX18_C0027G0006 [Candidatus Azambacteria bacterium GW2011_GWC2_45_7b]